MQKRFLALVLAMLLLFPTAALAASRYHSAKLLVESYSLDTQTFEAGTQTLLRLQIRNTNETTSVGNCMFTLTDDSGKIIALEEQGATAVYVPEIGRGAKTEITFLLKSLPDALPGNVPMTLQADYETTQGGMESLSANVYIPLAQAIRFEHGPVRLPVLVTEGDNTSCSVDFFNLGKGGIYNVLLKFFVPGFDGGSATLLGNVLPGESKTARANLLVSAPNGQYDPVEGTVLLSWEDAEGNVYEEECPLASTIQRRKSIEELTEALQAEEEKEPLVPLSWLFLLCALGGALVTFVIQKAVYSHRMRLRDEKLL